MQGILFLHDQAGQAIQQLQKENDELKARIAELEDERDAAPTAEGSKGGLPGLLDTNTRVSPGEPQN